jgi:hypothetical protein
VQAFDRAVPAEAMTILRRNMVEQIEFAIAAQTTARDRFVAP